MSVDVGKKPALLAILNLRYFLINVKFSRALSYISPFFLDLIGNNSVLIFNTHREEMFIMSRNTSVTLGRHFSEFVEDIIEAGRFESTSEAVRAGLRLLEQEETQLDLLRQKLATGDAQLNRGEGVDGEQFMNELMA